MADYRFGIDVSKWQGNFNFINAKNNHQIEFALLRIGGADSSVYKDGLYKDTEFENNYKKCKDAGIPVGCYFFGKAMNMTDAAREVSYWIGLMKGKQFEYPVFYDVEGKMLSVEKRQLTDISKYVLEQLTKNGFYPGIYSSVEGFDYNLYDAELKEYIHWVASWKISKPRLASGNTVHIWQFGGETNVIWSNRINGVVCDQDFCYVTNFEDVIKKKRLNGYTALSVVTENVKKTAKKAVNKVTGNLQYKVGDTVKITGGFDSSTAEDFKVIPVDKLAKKKGKITKIQKNAKNPYYIKDLCWTNDKYITCKVEKVESAKLIVGDKVTLKNNAVYSDGKTIPAWVKKETLYVRKIDKNGVDIVISTLKTGDVTGTVNKKYLKKM